MLLKILIYAPMAFLVASALHEGGHLLAGLAQGFKFHWFVAGPIGIRRNDQDKITLYMETNLSLWGGISATIPKTVRDENIGKFANVLLAGPLASLIVGCFGLWIALQWDLAFLLLVGAMSIGMAVSTLMPLKNGAFYTDGARWLRMLPGAKTRKLEAAIWELTQASIVHGYGAIDLNAVAVLKASAAITDQYLGYYYAHEHYKALGDTAAKDQERLEASRLSHKVPKQLLQMMPLI